MTRICKVTVTLILTLFSTLAFGADKFYPGKLWFDTDGRIINAHGGGILAHNGTFYWFGEHKSDHTNSALEGVTCYSSTDLYNWTYRGIALAVTDSVGAPLERGCVMERPKVVHCAATGKFVMYLHLELKGRGYGAAECAVAVSDSPCGPYSLVSHGRVNPGKLPQGFELPSRQFDLQQEWWTDQWWRDIADGMLTLRDLDRGQMARDQTLFVDDDGTAYHIYSSEENLTLQIAELSPDYLTHTGRYVRLAPGGHNEAPTIFKCRGRYYLITSGCTGWAPNAARMFCADSIWGPWTALDNPCRGEGADLTFGGQGTYVLSLPDDRYIFMADQWRPENPIDGRYLWLPISFDAADGAPVIEFRTEWRLSD
jgi:beta-xylosidase